MRRTYGIGVAILLILAAIAIGVGAYNAGLSQGVADADGASRVVFVGHHGVFGIGWILFPLLFFGLFALKAGRWRGHPHGGHGHGPWGPGGVEDLHRRLHEEEATAPKGGDGTGTA